MTLSEAVAQGPAWLAIWLNVLLFGAFILPLTLLIWKSTRVAGLMTLGASILAALGVNWMYLKMGYVKLLGLPHVILWTPIVIFLLSKLRSADVGRTPKIIIALILLTLTISLAFDYVDVFRYLLGDRTPMPGTP